MKETNTLNSIYPFESLENAPLRIDAIYEGGNKGNSGDDPLNKLLGVGISGGFRPRRGIQPNSLAFVVLYTSGSESEWPDEINFETGHVRYYGDNRDAGRELHEKRGNQLLRDAFHNISEQNYKNVPPFLLFRKSPTIKSSRSVTFVGLAVPGRQQFSIDESLVAIWRTHKGSRFQNYEAYFTLLDTANETEKLKDWLIMRTVDLEASAKIAPEQWKIFVSKGLNTITPLIAEPITKFRTKEEQLPNTSEGYKALKIIYTYFKDKPIQFEFFAAHILRVMDKNFVKFNLTRASRDGGRDAIGLYKIGVQNSILTIDCAMEAKCYSPLNGCHVKQTNRLISRIRHRQFGVFVTTSYISSQVYKELLEDEHPILVISGRDIVAILKKIHIDEKNIEAYIERVLAKK
ncbi:restriction endonuclease [Bacillus subtilis]|uniref:restriction endonuclease n=1 Tax=Bacillus TaxID=1386 RepID=UPI001425D1D9|nr:restriction endonuclease [Bacillus subtilis]MDI6549389.1 restriction endonuclease [Bacillus subtilis]MEC1254892.1 restriction endonuclease [Bacillus subtilis]MEC1312596.1 restriction endonuclease [Bacillus subtilis]MEC2338702.1 restriction endonuclease [Bacillus subtilis]MED5593184.1 restriction endonuclease [Bacillus subtilis]